MLVTKDPTKITHPYFNDPTNRWLNGLSNSEHHSLSALSSSAIKYFHKHSPWAFYKKYVLKEVKPADFKPEFKMGTLIHLALLEPEKFEKTVFVCDEASNTNKYKDLRDSVLNNFKINEKNSEQKNPLVMPINPKNNPECADSIEGDIYKEAEQLSEEIKVAKKRRLKKNKESGDRDLINLSGPDSIEEVIKPEVIVSKNGGYIVGDEEIYIIKTHEMKMLREIQKNAQEHTKFNLMLRNCQYIEQSGIARCPRTGLYLSCRGDARSDQGYFIDPKSAADITQHGMESSQAYFSYFLQHAHYLYVANLIEPGKYNWFYFLYVSKESPYEICFSHLDDESISRSEDLYIRILDRIAQCEYNQKWPTYDNGNGVRISVPAWAFK